MALTTVTSGPHNMVLNTGSTPHVESKLPKTFLTPPKTVAIQSETKTPSAATYYSFPAKELKLPNGTVPQIMVIDGMRKVFNNPAPSPTDETFIKAQENWRTKFRTTNLKLNSFYEERLSSIAARYFCSPQSKESGFETVEPETKNDQSIYLFSQADWLRICLEVKKMKKEGASKSLSEFLALDLHSKKDIQITSCVRTKIRDDFEGEEREQILESMQAEAAHLAHLDHPAICPILSAAIDKDDGVMSILPYYPRDFKDYFCFDIKQFPPFALFVQEMLGALVECSKKDITHLDIKPENILCGLNHKPSLADFGLSDLCLGTPAYQHIDAIIGTIDALTPKLDMWGMGNIFYLHALIDKKGVLKDILKNFPESDREYLQESPTSTQVIPFLLLPWGDLGYLYTRIKELLEIYDEPQGDKPQTDVDQDLESEVQNITTYINDALIAVGYLKDYDCSSWIAFENYNLEKLRGLLEITASLHDLVDNAEKYKKIMGSDSFLTACLNKVEPTVLLKLKDMRTALTMPPKKLKPGLGVLPFEAWITFHTLHPDSLYSAEELLKRVTSATSSSSTSASSSTR